MSIIKMMDRLNPKRIVVVSSAPQIRYPDCYGIDMAKLEGLVAFSRFRITQGTQFIPYC
jgi:amidophosphoribosyltransferase